MAFFRVLFTVGKNDLKIIMMILYANYIFTLF